MFPAVIDTPGLAHGANVSGRAINPRGPFYAPEEVAETIVRLARHPRDEVAVGWPARAAQIAYALAPGPTEHLMGAGMRRALRQADPAPRTEGALMRPVPEGTGVGGGWRERKGDAGRMSRVLGLAAVGALTFGVAALIRSRSAS